MKIEKLGVLEMNTDELVNIDGGGWLDDLVDFAEDAGKVVGHAVGTAVGAAAVAVLIVAQTVTGN